MPKYLDKKWINGKWRYFYDKVGKLGGSAKVSAIRATDAARRGATAILKSAKGANHKLIASKAKMRENWLGKAIGRARIEDNERRKRGNARSALSSDLHPSYDGRNRIDKLLRNMSNAGKKYYKSNNATIAANKKGKSQTEYYKNLAKKQAAAKARKRQDDLDRMTSGGSASDRNQLLSARKYGKSLRSTTKSETKRRNNDLNRMTSGGSASDREALRKAAAKKRIAANNKAIEANKKGKSQTEYYKNLAKKQAAAKARKRQADLDRMTSTSKSDASIFSNTPRRPGYLDLGIDKKGIHYRLNMGKKGKKKTKKGSRSGFSWSYK